MLVVTLVGVAVLGRLLLLLLNRLLGFLGWLLLLLLLLGELILLPLLLVDLFLFGFQSWCILLRVRWGLFFVRELWCLLSVCIRLLLMIRARRVLVVVALVLVRVLLVTVSILIYWGLGNGVSVLIVSRVRSRALWVPFSRHLLSVIRVLSIVVWSLGVTHVRLLVAMAVLHGRLGIALLVVVRWVPLVAVALVRVGCSVAFLMVVAVGVVMRILFRVGRVLGSIVALHVFRLLLLRRDTVWLEVFCSV